MTVHTKVTTIGHSVSGMGQVWYRVTGSAGVANPQVAYRVGTQDPAVRRVRFVGAGGTARLLRFTPGRLVTSASDMESIARAFSGEHLTHGVKTRRSKLARVPAAPVLDVVSSALAMAGLDPSAVFTSRDAQNWWRSMSNAAARDRSLSFLTAEGVLRVAARAGASVTEADLHAAVGAHLRGVLDGPVDVRRGDRGVLALPGLELGDVMAHDDEALGTHAWSQARREAGRHDVVGNAGYELTLTLPKSFSLYAVSGDPALRGQWLEVMETAAARALEQLMAEAGFCSTGHRGDGQDVQVLEADGWAGFIATEISSRAGDPHLHVHCTLPNVLVGRDGVVRTMADGGRELILNSSRFAAWGQAFVIEEARARGLFTDTWLNVTTRQWEVGGFSSETIDLFSRGRQAVLAEESVTDDSAARDQRGRGRVSRAAKGRATSAKADEQPSWGQLRATALHQAARAGIDLELERGGSVTAPFADPSVWSDEDWVGWVARVTCEHESTTSRAQINAVVDLTGVLLPPAERERIRALVLETGFTRGHASRDLGMRTGGQKWISTLALRAEQRLLRLYAGGLDRPPATAPSRGTAVAVNRLEVANGWQLSDEQVAAVTEMVDGTCPVTLVSGVGGSGKTTVLAAVNEANKNHRYGLLVASTATIAASTAGDASGARWMNLTALRHAIWDKRPIAAHIIVIDEASMADVDTIDQVATWCAQTGRRLVLMGDHRQLRAVGAGDAFNALCAEHPDRVVRLQTNQRQRTDLGRTIADALHSRDVESAWQAMRDGEAVIVTRSREHKLHVLAATVASRIDQHGAGQVTCDAVTNAEVDELNARIHERLIAAGNVDTAGVVTYRSSRGERRIGVGTVLRVTRPTGVAAKPGTQLIRGERATVTSTSRERVTVTFDDGRTRAIKPRTLLAHFDYGYAGTTHKVQGQTSSVHVASLGPAKDIASMYVSATRARDETLFVLDARDYLTDAELVRMQAWEPTQIDDEVLDRAQTALTRRVDRIDSPRDQLRAAPQPAAYTPTPYPASASYGGMSM